MSLNQKLQKLHRILQGTRTAIVAFSGGVDSTFLAKIAKDLLKENALAVTVETPLLSQEEKRSALKMAQKLKLNHEVSSLKLPAEVWKNPVNRCYKCKSAIFTYLRDFARRNGYTCVMEGSNRDDLKDYRPGRKALQELGIRSPLQESGLTKADIRLLSRRLGLETWDKPSSPCLATRVAYGESITPAKLKIIMAAENFLNNLGFNPARVRLHGEVARIEVERRKVPALLKNNGRITKKMKALGILYVCVDLAGYRSGAMNEGLKWKNKKS